MPIANLSLLEITPLTFLFASLTNSRCHDGWIPWHNWSRHNYWLRNKNRLGILTSVSTQRFFFRNYFVQLSWVSSYQSTEYSLKSGYNSFIFFIFIPVIIFILNLIYFLYETPGYGFLYMKFYLDFNRKINSICKHDFHSANIVV